MSPVVGHRHRLGVALGFVVHASGTDRIDIAPVVLRLGVDPGVTVDLRGGRQQVAGAVMAREPERVVGPESPDLECLYGQRGVVHRAGGRRKVQDAVHPGLHEEWRGDIVLDQIEARFTPQVRQVPAGTGQEVVDADDFISVRQETIRQMGTKKTRHSGDQDSSRHYQFAPGSAARRPIEWYSNPCARIARGE